MVLLKPHRVDPLNNNTPILSNREIDEYAHAVLADYRPKLLRWPGIINYEHFIESYLGLNLIVHDLYSDDPDRPVLGMTAFKTCRAEVFDRENDCVNEIIIPARSVVLNNMIAEPDEMEHVARFSGVHEGGHALMQWHVFTGETIDGTPFSPDYDWEDMYPAVCCRRENIESQIYLRKERSAEEWREHHADYFAGAVTMPNATFIPFVRNLLREHKYYKNSVLLGMNEDWDILAYDLLPELINEVYGVSKTAARIKLRTSGFVKGSLGI